MAKMCPRGTADVLNLYAGQHASSKSSRNLSSHSPDAINQNETITKQDTEH